MRVFNHTKFQEHLKTIDTPIQEIYKKIGVSDTRLYSLKNGHKEVSKITLLLNICNELDLDPREMFVQDASKLANH